MRWQVSALSSINRCVKETTQAVKGDAPGKFKFPKEPGKERGAQRQAPHPQCHSALRSRWGPAAVLSMRAGWRGDTLSGCRWLSLRRWALRLPGVNPASPVGAWPQQGASWAPRARCLRVRLCAKATGGPAAATPSSPPLASDTTMSEGFVTCSLKSLAGRMRVFLSWLVGFPVHRSGRSLQGPLGGPWAARTCELYKAGSTPGPWEAPAQSLGVLCWLRLPGNKDVTVVATDYRTYAIVNVAFQKGRTAHSVLKLYSEPLGALPSPRPAWPCGGHPQPGEGAGAASVALASAQAPAAKGTPPGQAGTWNTMRESWPTSSWRPRSAGCPPPACSCSSRTVSVRAAGSGRPSPSPQVTILSCPQ